MCVLFVCVCGVVAFSHCFCFLYILANLSSFLENGLVPACLFLPSFPISFLNSSFVSIRKIYIIYSKNTRFLQNRKEKFLKQTLT